MTITWKWKSFWFYPKIHSIFHLKLLHILPRNNKVKKFAWSFCRFIKNKRTKIWHVHNYWHWWYSKQSWGASYFHWSSVRWSLPVVNSIDWTWFWKALICRWCMLERKPSHEIWGIICRPLRQDCMEAQISGRVQVSAVLTIPVSTMASIIYKWKKFGTIITLPRAWSW